MEPSKEVPYWDFDFSGSLLNCHSRRAPHGTREFKLQNGRHVYWCLMLSLLRSCRLHFWHEWQFVIDSLVLSSVFFAGCLLVDYHPATKHWHRTSLIDRSLSESETKPQISYCPLLLTIIPDWPMFSGWIKPVAVGCCVSSHFWCLPLILIN